MIQSYYYCILYCSLIPRSDKSHVWSVHKNQQAEGKYRVKKRSNIKDRKYRMYCTDNTKGELVLFKFKRQKQIFCLEIVDDSIIFKLF